MSAPMPRRRRACWKRSRKPDAQGQKLLRDAAETMRLSARGYHRVLRVARTLADLDGAEKIGRLHLAEALSYRALAEDCGAPPDSARDFVTPRRRQPGGNEFSLRSANHKPRVSAGPWLERVACHVAFQDLASVVPLIVAAVLARSRVRARPRVPASRSARPRSRSPPLPWHADLHVSLHRRSRSWRRCGSRSPTTPRPPISPWSMTSTAPRPTPATATAATQFVAISAHARRGRAGDLSVARDGPADYRIFVRSKTLHGARSRRPDRRRPRRPSAPRRRIALNRPLTLRQPCSHRGTAARPQTLCKVAAASSPARAVTG